MQNAFNGFTFLLFLIGFWGCLIEFPCQTRHGSWRLRFVSNLRTRSDERNQFSLNLVTKLEWHRMTRVNFISKKLTKSNQKHLLSWLSDLQHNNFYIFSPFLKMPKQLSRSFLCLILPWSCSINFAGHAVQVVRSIIALSKCNGKFIRI